MRKQPVRPPYPHYLLVGDNKGARLNLPAPTLYAARQWAIGLRNAGGEVVGIYRYVRLKEKKGGE